MRSLAQGTTELYGLRLPVRAKTGRGTLQHEVAPTGTCLCAVCYQLKNVWCCSCLDISITQAFSWPSLFQYK